MLQKLLSPAFILPISEKPSDRQLTLCRNAVHINLHIPQVLPGNLFENSEVCDVLVKLKVFVSHKRSSSISVVVPICVSAFFWYLRIGNVSEVKPVMTELNPGLRLLFLFSFFFLFFVHPFWEKVEILIEVWNLPFCSTLDLVHLWWKVVCFCLL